MDVGLDRYRHGEEREAARDKSRLSAGSSRFLFRPSQHTRLKKRGEGGESGLTTIREQLLLLKPVIGVPRLH